MNYFSLIFSNNSVLRNLQIQAFKNFKLNGVCLEFGASHKLNRNFLKESSKKYKTFYSNICQIFNIDDNYKYACKIHKQWYNLHLKSEKEIVSDLTKLYC